MDPVFGTLHLPGELLDEAKSLCNKIVKIHITLNYIKDHSEIKVAISEDSLLNVSIDILVYPRDKNDVPSKRS